MKGNPASQLPFNNRNMENAGRYHGSGLPAKVGQKKGGKNDFRSTNKEQIGTPPRKFN